MKRATGRDATTGAQCSLRVIYEGRSTYALRLLTILLTSVPTATGFRKLVAKKMNVLASLNKVARNLVAAVTNVLVVESPLWTSGQLGW